MSPLQRKRLSIALLCSPLLLFVALTGFAVTSFIAQAMLMSGDTSQSTVALMTLLRVFWSVLGLLGVAGLLIGVPVGVYLVVTDGRPGSAVPKSRSVKIVIGGVLVAIIAYTGVYTYLTLKNEPEPFTPVPKDILTDIDTPTLR